MTERDFFQKYRELVVRVDGEAARVAELHGARLRCAAGCSQCCAISSVLPLEAALLRQAVGLLADQVKERIRAQAGKGGCPLLIDSLCAVYPGRPLICRTHGLPVAYVDHARQAIEVSACPLNFADDYEFERQELFFIDPFNGELAGLNEGYCAGLGMDSGTRVPMRDLLD